MRREINNENSFSPVSPEQTSYGDTASHVQKTKVASYVILLKQLTKGCSILRNLYEAYEAKVAQCDKFSLLIFLNLTIFLLGFDH